MIKETKKVPTIRFRGFTDDWERRKLGDIVQITMGQSPKGSTYSEEPSDYILVQGNADLENGWVKPRIWTTQKTKTADAGDLIMSVRAPAGAMAKTAYSVVIGRGVAAIKGNEFIFQTLLKMDFEEYWKKLATGSTFEAINSDTLFNANIMVSSQSEQEEIGKFFIHIDSLITLHQRKLEQQKKLKAFFLKNMFPEEGETVPRIRFKGFTGDWEQRKLGEIGTTFSGLSGKAKEDFGHGEAQFVTYMNVYLNAVSDSSMTERVEIDDHQNKVQYGDVFFTTSSETPDEVGMASVWFGSKDNTYLNSFCFGFRPTKEIDPYYMAFMLRSDIIRRKIIILAQGISRYNLSKKQVMKIVVPLPELSEQYKIGAYLQSLDHLITLHQRKLDQLQVMKKFMLQNLFV